MQLIVRLAVIWSVALAITALAGAQETVPFELELPVAAVDLNLFDCRLEVVTEKDAQPLVRMQPDVQNQGYAAGVAASVLAG